jgi:hypothetical protein
LYRLEGIHEGEGLKPFPFVYDAREGNCIIGTHSLMPERRIAVCGKNGFFDE